MRFLRPWLLTLMVAAACSQGDSSSTPSGVDANQLLGGAATEDVASLVACPVALPAEGAACNQTEQPTICTLGDQPPFACRRAAASCTNGAWHLEAGSCPESKDIAACSAAYTKLDQQACSKAAQLCHDADVVCVCRGVQVGEGGNVGVSSSDFAWACEQPKTQTSCPLWAPNLRSPCSPEGATCDFSWNNESGHDCNLWRVTCSKGLWQVVPKLTPNPCPV